ncbi:hypothetical protein NEOLEDRAFT_1148724 [Neolentinus lepideus HHB14362 ss-1]|uniref:Uncharacterized protein n=1 Tax=Neolentinus lepideus HHB14362 ss-1 TaxID=1314782 RepID=A0A165RW87_9AGAM|nr:hypothetical protein NEOLEDRAFT_1148724 [Neolentinus lepideus HHB14362 ss-1]
MRLRVLPLHCHTPLARNIIAVELALSHIATNSKWFSGTIVQDRLGKCSVCDSPSGLSARRIGYVKGLSNYPMRLDGVHFNFEVRNTALACYLRPFHKLLCPHTSDVRTPERAYGLRIGIEVGDLQEQNAEWKSQSHKTYEDPFGNTQRPQTSSGAGVTTQTLVHGEHVCDRLRQAVRHCVNLPSEREPSGYGHGSNNIELRRMQAGMKARRRAVVSDLRVGGNGKDDICKGPRSERHTGRVAPHVPAGIELVQNNKPATHITCAELSLTREFTGKRVLNQRSVQVAQKEKQTVRVPDNEEVVPRFFKGAYVWHLEKQNSTDVKDRSSSMGEGLPALGWKEATKEYQACHITAME